MISIFPNAIFLSAGAADSPGGAPVLTEERISVLSPWQEQLVGGLESCGLLGAGDSLWWRLLLFLGLAAAVFAIAYAVRIAAGRCFGKFASKTGNGWDDILSKNRLLEKLVDVAPFYISLAYVPVFFSAAEHGILFAVLGRGLHALIILFAMRFLLAVLDCVRDLVERSASFRNKPLAGFIQGVKIVLVIVFAINAVSVVAGANPNKLLVSLGASAAILTLVFKDTILGLVAGVQFSAYDMLRVGDWITMPKYNADGDVIQIGLNSIKVKNFDNTITTIPTYALVSDSFQNWRGMSESGGRRIKRSISIDMRSVRFCSPEMLARFGRIQLLKGYLEKKREELEEYNRKNGIDDNVLVNGRRQTNLGVFRAYIEEYLRAHPLVNRRMTCMVRQLQPTERGIPLELYFFADDVRWIQYENIQSDVFDHILSIIPEFDLRVFQNMSGYDLSELAGRLKS